MEIAACFFIEPLVDASVLKRGLGFAPFVSVMLSEGESVVLECNNVVKCWISDLYMYIISGTYLSIYRFELKRKTDLVKVFCFSICSRSDIPVAAEMLAEFPS